MINHHGKVTMDMDTHHTEEQGAGGYGTPTPEQETPGQSTAGQSTTGQPTGESSGRPQDRSGDKQGSAQEESVDAPSADADIDGSNAEQEPERPFSSEPKGDATGLPEEKSPKDDDGERFDAG